MSTSAADTAFSIKTDVFEGPLDLLLDLVEQRKLLINDISLAAVTDEYLERVAEMQEASLHGTAHFVQLAATLLLIKSKSLLPVLELSDEEEQSIEELEERLKLYQIYRAAATQLQSVFGGRMMHERQFAPRTEPVFKTDAYTTRDELHAAMLRVLSELPKTEQKPNVALKSTISIEEMIARLHKRIESSMRLRFSDLLAGDNERTTVIVSFLAVLESVKQGSVLVAQTKRFDEIEIEKEGISAPRYE